MLVLKLYIHKQQIWTWQALFIYICAYTHIHAINVIKEKTGHQLENGVAWERFEGGHLGGAGRRKRGRK